MQTQINNLQWMIGGEAGFGIKVTGQMFSRMCVRGGLQTFDYTEYPSLIRGGHNAFQVVVRDREVRSPVQPVDLLVALNQETIALHSGRLSPQGGIMFDPDQTDISVAHLDAKKVRLYPVPLARIAREAGGTILMRNVVSLGASVGLLDYDFGLLEGVIHTAFDRKGSTVVEQNLRAARAGYTFATQQFRHDCAFTLKPVRAPKRMSLTGNTALCLGAIKAGCKYYAAYPMTPTSSLLSYLAKHAAEVGMIVRHAEDEIAAINSAIGASYAGVRSMVGTAGGGFSLMVEGVGLAAMTETPLVIVEGQRPGPSTGLPTWTSQSDLQFILHAGQDDFPRIVIAPGDVSECFYAAFQAFNLAEKYQLPVFVLTDKFLGESAMSVEPFATEHLRHERGMLVRNVSAEMNGQFRRYAVTHDGVSPRTFPGVPGGVHTANSDEHDEFGAVNESAANRVAMMEKRMRKLTTALADIPMPMLYGPPSADLTLISWGSTKGPALEALDMIRNASAKVNLLHFVYLDPLPVQKLEALLRSCKATMVLENNFTGQFAQHLKQAVGLLPEHTLRKYDGRPFFPEEIAQKIREVTA